MVDVLGAVVVVLTTVVVVAGSFVQQRTSTGNDSQPVAPADDAVQSPAHSFCLLHAPFELLKVHVTVAVVGVGAVVVVVIVVVVVVA